MPNGQFIQTCVGPSQATETEFSVPASVTIAQAILESGWGKSHMGDANNYFGIKAKGPTSFGPIAVGAVQLPTREVINGKSVMVNAWFRAYASMTDSFRDHGDFLRRNSRYQGAFQHSDDADEFARKVAQAGYATDPNYANALINIMRANNLYQYNVAAGQSSGQAPVYTPVKPDWPLVRLNANRPAVLTLKLLLQERNNLTLTFDTNFDAATDRAVRLFQGQNGLVVDGIVGPKTWAKLTVTRRIGNTGAAVSGIQQLLGLWDIDLAITDAEGVFGPSTEAAVTAFQTMYRLNAIDGIVGPETWQWLVGFYG